MQLVSLTCNFHFGIVTQGILQLFNGVYCEGGSHRKECVPKLSGNEDSIMGNFQN